jgi:hypothetical protein
MLEMKNECLECHCELFDGSEAHVCLYECTYCASCATDRNFICKNCGGDLQKRPKREKNWLLIKLLSCPIVKR